MFPSRPGALSGIVRRFLLFPRVSSSLSIASRTFSQLTRISSTNGLRNWRLLLSRAGEQQQRTGAMAVGSTVRQLEQVRGMKTRSSVKRLCDGCKVLLLHSFHRSFRSVWAERRLILSWFLLLTVVENWI